MNTQTTTSRVIQFSSYGDATHLEYASRTLAPLAPGAVRVRQQIAGVNYVDVYYRVGRYPLPLPGVPGVEGSGVIEAVGADVPMLKAGQRVAWVARSGGYAEHVDLDASRVIALPDDISLEQGGAGMLRAMTGYLLLNHYARLQRGQTVLVHAAAGGLGLLLTQWAKGMGARVIGTVSSAEKAALAQSRGLDDVINYRQEDFIARVHALTDGKGVDAVIDGIGGQHVLHSIEATRSGGMTISIGSISGEGAPAEALPAAQARGVLLERPSILSFIGELQQYRVAAAAAVTQLQAGLQIDIADRLPLQDAAQAHRLLESGAVQGALLLTL
ncbi:quinone oxidoreductase family protein [Herbaspirillum rhizosphaerae]|uniref:quinone oxidoreductase family protein n=1 Tax=Herbaspirillum rhizosphaerae TaxID=346179 RepID=UPI0009F91E90|nr:quinone oxidoreductase [Herbaspirillum rhizosphaerae]